MGDHENDSKWKMVQTVASEDATFPARLAVKLALPAHLIRCVRRRAGVELFPTRLAIGRPAILNVYRSAIKNCLALWTIRVRNPGGHQSAPASNSFRIDMGIFLADTRGGESPNQTTGGPAYHGPKRSRSEPTGCNHRTQAGNGEQAEAGEQPGASSNHSTYPRACAGSLSAIVNTVPISVHAVRRAHATGQRAVISSVPPVSVTRDDTDLRLRNACCLQVPNCLLRGAIVIE
jgi:hypothetical protein